VERAAQESFQDKHLERALDQFAGVGYLSHKYLMGSLAVNHPIRQLPKESQPLKRGIIPVRSRRGLRAKKNSSAPDSGGSLPTKK